MVGSIDRNLLSFSLRGASDEVQALFFDSILISYEDM